jgi:Acyl-CoA carboxylase epsilon subunit
VIPDTNPNPKVAVVRGEPTDEELAAIVAAIEVTWPRPTTAPAAELPRWRFSGRSWTKPVPLRRVRPWAR